MIIVENMIDGYALVALVDDLAEFRLLIPQSGLRIRLKKIISNNVSTSPSAYLSFMLIVINSV